MDSYDELLKSQFFYVENLQFRENVAAWVCFYDRKDIFKGFLERVLRLKEVCLLFLSMVVFWSFYYKDFCSCFVCL